MVSIIITTYKRAKYIIRAIDSVLDQTYQNIEIIVVDDNDPNTIYRQEMKEIMKRYKENPNVIYLQHEHNMNGAAARNTGLSVAKGEYIGFLDDDDYFLPQRIEKLVNVLEKYPEYNAAYSSVIVTKSKKIIGIVEAKQTGNFHKELLLNNFSFGTGSNLFFRAETIKQIKGFDVRFRRHQDIEVMIRYFRDNSIIAVYDPLVVKVQDDRINEPNINDYLKIKELYFNSFYPDIDSFTKNEKNTFYKINYQQILSKAIVGKKYSDYQFLKNLINRYGQISFKQNLRYFLLFVNNYIKIENIKYLKKRHYVNKKFNKEANFIKKIESKYGD